MKILMTGGTGFVGTRLTERLSREGHEITILTRSGKKEAAQPGVAYLEGDPTQRGSWQEAVRNQGLIINLAGASIFNKWTEEYKRALRESRMTTTRNLVEAMEVPAGKQVSLFSASAIGYYGFHGDEELTEESPSGDDFLARLALDWETQARQAELKGARVVLTRFGIVLGAKGGALSQMIPLFKRFWGGPIGTGRQWFSWVHMKDLSEAFVFLVNHPAISGPVNVCAPHPVRNLDFARALGKALHRPSSMPAPAFMIKLVLGEFGSVILQGQRVIPRRLCDEGFIFRYPEIAPALEDLIHGTR